MTRPFIVTGDATDHGGTVIGGAASTDTGGKRIARVGDQVTCPRRGHGGTTVIASGDPTVIIDGSPAARHGDLTACGAVLISQQCATGSA
ncbi:MAG TPA: PAAR domain-containing protein [Noviherbaspirillum sp.]|nr:PAAR domain-containing protein [Noviherbaspirillum sp.]